jgi:hypothetical protein
VTVVHSFADVEQLLYGWVPTVVTARAVTETPSNLATVTATEPLVRLTRIGGPVGDPGFDEPIVDFDCFGSNRPAAKALAIQLMAAVLYLLPGYTNNYGSVLNSEIRSGPSIRPWVNTNIRRVGFTAALTVHSRI